MYKRYQCVRLDNICNIRYGRSIRSALVNAPGSDIKLVQTKDFNMNGIDWDKCASTIHVGNKMPQILQEDDILFIIRSRLNQAFLVDASINNVKEKVIFGALMYGLRCHETKVLPEYLAWWINQEPAQKYFRGKTDAVSAVDPSTKRDTLMGLPVVLPSLKDQAVIMNEQRQLKTEMAVLQEKMDNLAIKVQESANPMGCYSSQIYF